MELTLQKSEDRKPLPDGTTWEAIVESIEERESRWWVDENDHDKGKKMELSWKFKIIDPDGEYDGRWIWGSTSTYFGTSPKNKLRQWIQAALDEDVLPEGFVVNTQDLIGKQVLLVVDARKANNGNTYNNITDVRISRARRAATSGSLQQATPAPEPEPSYEDEPF